MFIEVSSDPVIYVDRKRVETFYSTPEVDGSWAAKIHLEGGKILEVDDIDQDGDEGRAFILGLAARLNEFRGQA